MRMKQICIVCCVGIGVAALFCECYGAVKGQASAAKAPSLEQRIATLEAKVAELEKQIAAQRVAQPPLASPGTIGPGNVPTPLVAPGSPSTLPRGAEPHKFNGQTYYLVPLGKVAAR
ncbi:MAG TPA: hypothetical protein VFW73_02720 [Lacipirellulaceae bacterium]|nr:hypothetical protein [Lacipirellulaceae bacterium]